MDDLQNIFLIFYAIFWGYIAAMQHHWKAFHFPLIFKITQARCRTALSVVLFNIVPLMYFSYVMIALSDRKLNGLTAPIVAVYYLISGVLPAFAVFGFYRLWLGVIELNADCFYAADAHTIDERYRHVEPTYRRAVDYRSTPVVDLGDNYTGWMNCLFGSIYIIIAALAPWLLFFLHVCPDKTEDCLLSMGWPVDLTWYKLLMDWGSIIGGIFALMAAIAVVVVTRQVANKQIAALKANLQADMMLRLMAKFDSPPFQQRLEIAAAACLANLSSKNPGSDVDDVIDFFDDAAFLVKRGDMDIEMMWHPFYHRIRLFYQASQQYIIEYRNREGAVWNYLYSIYPRLNDLEKANSPPNAYKEKLDNSELETELKKLMAPPPNDAPNGVNFL